MRTFDTWLLVLRRFSSPVLLWHHTCQWSRDMRLPAPIYYVGIAETYSLFKKEPEEELKTTILFPILIAWIFLLSSPGLIGYYAAGEQYDRRGAAGYLSDHETEFDSLYLMPGYNSVPLEYYYRPVEIAIENVSTIRDLNISSLDSRDFIVCTRDVQATDKELIKWLNENSTPIWKGSSVIIAKISQGEIINEKIISDPRPRRISSHSRYRDRPRHIHRANSPRSAQNTRIHHHRKENIAFFHRGPPAGVDIHTILSSMPGKIRGKLISIALYISKPIFMLTFPIHTPGCHRIGRRYPHGPGSLIPPIPGPSRARESFFFS